jgi:hypothetical protein
MEPIEVKILQYTFQFRQLSWREENAIVYTKGEDRLKTILSYALVEVSGLKVKSREEAMKVLRPLPSAVVQRCFVMYKGSFPMPRRFSTMGLYKAPEPGRLVKRMEEVEQQRDHIMDKVEQELEAKFGRRELDETLAAEREMLKNSGGRGLTKATPDDDERTGKFGAAPPIKQGGINQDEVVKKIIKPAITRRDAD